MLHRLSCQLIYTLHTRSPWCSSDLLKWKMKSPNVVIMHWNPFCLEMAVAFGHNKGVLTFLKPTVDKAPSYILIVHWAATRSNRRNLHPSSTRIPERARQIREGSNC
jgi:hypothetical protein